jgi:hypothetical protein
MGFGVGRSAFPGPPGPWRPDSTGSLKDSAEAIRCDMAMLWGPAVKQRTTYYRAFLYMNVTYIYIYILYNDHIIIMTSPLLS